jgi:NTP pyrophosphatase (non-canonical NTP hydrolase)
MDLTELTQRMHDFVRAKGWYEPGSPRPQTPRNIATSLCIEAAEVLEHFQWNGEVQDRDALAGELADVALYLLQLASVAASTASGDLPNSKPITADWDEDAEQRRRDSAITGREQGLHEPTGQRKPGLCGGRGGATRSPTRATCWRSAFGALGRLGAQVRKQLSDTQAGGMLPGQKNAASSREAWRGRDDSDGRPAAVFGLRYQLRTRAALPARCGKKVATRRWRPPRARPHGAGLDDPGVPRAAARPVGY